MRKTRTISLSEEMIERIKAYKQYDPELIYQDE